MLNTALLRALEKRSSLVFTCCSWRVYLIARTLSHVGTFHAVPNKPKFFCCYAPFIPMFRDIMRRITDEKTCNTSWAKYHDFRNLSTLVCFENDAPVLSLWLIANTSHSVQSKRFTLTRSCTLYNKFLSLSISLASL